VEALCAAPPAIEAKAPLSKAELEAEQEAYLQDLLQTQTQAESAKTQAEWRLVEAKRATQLAKQRAALEKKERQQVERQQERERGHAVRREEFERKYGRPPVCPRYNVSEDCEGHQCSDIGNGRFSHPERCLNPKHVVRGQVGDCVLWHFWVKQPKKKPVIPVWGNLQRGAKGSKNSGGDPRKNGPKAKSGSGAGRNSNTTQRNGESKGMAELKAQMVEMKAMMSLQQRATWPPLPDPPTSATTPQAGTPTPTEALKQIALLLKAYA
jgi:hypothetical protein